jgi:serine/threonine protein kinase
VGDGQVPQAAPARQKQRLVVKCVAYMSNGEECRRMLREVCLMSTMRHPLVSSAVDAWTWKPPAPQPLQLCIVSRYGGNSLAAFLSKYNSAKPLPEPTARSIMQQLAAATCYLHSVAIIHRDIKSENVLVQELPDGQVAVRLIDFGLARVLAPLQVSPVAEACDEVPSSGGGSAGNCEDGEDGEDGEDSPDAIIRRLRAEDRESMGFGADSDSPSRRKAANIDGKRKQVTICEPDAPPLHRMDSGGRKRAQMTRHVVTHWYRPPELFIDSNRDAEYDATVDVWSLGCIFAEVMYRVHPPKADRNTHKWSGVLFCQQEDTTKFLKDVMALCGPPCDADVESMKRKLNASDAVVLTKLAAAAAHCRDTIDEHAVFSKMPQQARDLLRKSLQFNPRKRASAEEVYCHPYLGGSQTQLVEMAGGSAQIAATLQQNQSLKLEDKELVKSNMEALITLACQRVQQRRQEQALA